MRLYWTKHNSSICSFGKVRIYTPYIPGKVEHLENRFFVRRLVQADIAYLFQQREIDDAWQCFSCHATSVRNQSCRIVCS